MKNGRMANKKILKWVASGVMLALLFAMVFAGTLSGAFGVEEGLKNSGVIENNVADAAVITDKNLKLNDVNDVSYADSKDNWSDITTVDTISTNTDIYNNKDKYKGNSGGEITHSKKASNAAKSLANVKTSSSTSFDYTMVAINAYRSDSNQKGYKFTDSITLELTLPDNAQYISLSANIYAMAYRSDRLSSAKHGTKAVLKYYDNNSNVYKNIGFAEKANIENNSLHEDTVAVAVTIDVSGWSSKILKLVLDGEFYCYYGSSRSSQKEWVAGVGNLSIDVKGFETGDDGAYLLTNRSDFNTLSTAVDLGNSFEGKNFIVKPTSGTTIDMEGTAFTPIGKDTSHPFKGIINGNGCTIDKLTVSTSGVAGLFGVISGATISNITVNGTISGGSQVGGLVGYCVAGTNCQLLGKITCNTTVTGTGGMVGGVAGQCHATFNGATFTHTGDVSGEGDSVGGIFGFTDGNLVGAVNGSADNNGSVTGGTATGGIVGRIQGTLEDCTNYASVESNATGAHDKEVGSEIANFPKLSAVGGITGYCNGNVKDCYNYGSVTAQGSGVGGIIGINGLYNNDNTWTIGAISGCVNSGDVSAKPGVGGIIGYVIGSSVSGCTNKGKVTANKDAVAIDGSTSGAYAGGIAGYANGDVQHNYNEGTVTTVSDWNSSNLVGGIAGCLASGKTVSYCYNKGTVEGSSLVGGIVGNNAGTVTYCYFDGSLNDVWKGGVSFGYIVGGGTAAATYSWKLPNATGSVTTASNSLELGTGVSYLPAVDGDTCDWTDITSKNINAFVVTGSVATGKFFLSEAGKDSGDYLTPNSIESVESTTEGVEYEITARYNAEIGSNICCAVTDIEYATQVVVKDKDGNVLKDENGNDKLENKKYKAERQDIVVSLPTNGNVYEVVLDYGKDSEDNAIVPLNAGNYTGSITIYIKDADGNRIKDSNGNDLVVGEKTGISYTIDQAVLTINPKWADGYTGTDRTRTFTYNAQQQGVVEFTVEGLQGTDTVQNGDIAGAFTVNWVNRHEDWKNYTLSGNKFTLAKNTETTTYSTNAASSSYYFTINISSSNYEMTNTAYVWTINPFSLSKLENETAEAYKNRVMFGGYNGLVIGNTFDQYLSSVSSKNLNNALIYTGKNYSVNQFGVWVILDSNDSSNVSALTYSTEYYLQTKIGDGAFDNSLQSGGSEPVAITIKAKGEGNFAGEIEYTFTGMASDFGGNYTKNKDDENDLSDWGTASNPFEISHLEHLIRLSEIVNGKDAWNSWTSLNDKVANDINSNSYSGAYFKVTANIDLASYLGNNVSFTPIGYVDGEYFWRQDKNGTVEETADEKLHPFSGTFDGNDHAINLYVNAANTDFVGLFGLTQNATITNLTVTGSVTGGTYVAGIVGHALKTDITNCTNNAMISGVSYVGGIVGMAGNYKTHYAGYGFNASNLTNTGAITGTGNYVGGLAGYSRDVIYKGTIRNSAEVTGKSNTGGIMGTLCGGSLAGAENTDKVEGTAYTGGITGRVTWSNVSGILTNSGNVKGTVGVGGIVGAFNCTISGVNANKDLNSTWSTKSLTNHGTVDGTSYVGGIFGACNTGYSTTPTTPFVAGIVVNDKNVTGTGAYVGSVAGWLDASANKYNFVIEKKNGNSDANIIIDTTTTVTVSGKNFVGYLFGGLVGNGYSEEANAKTTTLKIDNTFSGNVNGTSGGAVLGGLVGYMSESALKFGTDDWGTGTSTNTSGTQISTITFGSMSDMSFVGGLVGVLGEGGYITSVETAKSTGGAYTITANTSFGGATLGDFVGGIVGYVSATAGYNGYAFKNVKFVNTSVITGGSYVGGIIGAIGRFDTTNANTIANNYSDVSSNLKGYLDAFDGTLMLFVDNTSSDAVQLRNNANISGSEYVGGIVGYVAGNVRVEFVGDLNEEPTAVEIKGTSYVGGLFGYLDNTLYSTNASGGTTTSTLDQALSNIPVRVSLSGTSNVGGIAGRMEGGKIEKCIVMLTFTATSGADISNVGGLVGYTNNVSVDSSFTTGMEVDDMVSNATIGGLVGGGVNPTVEKSWAFLTADSNATYATVSKNTYGKYVAVDKDVATDLTYANLVGFTSGTLTISVKLPDNQQLVFYDASGNDKVTGNTLVYNTDNTIKKDSAFQEFKQENGTLAIGLNTTTAESMLVYIKAVEFKNVAQWSSDSGKTKYDTVQEAYRHPSSSQQYEADITGIDKEEGGTQFNDGKIISITANIYFNPTGGAGSAVLVGTNYIGSYSSGSLTPGSENAPITISSWTEWIEFADSVRKGNTYETTVDGKTTKLVVSLTTDITLTSLKWTSDGTTYNAMAGDSTHSFKGIFEGNGHSITLSKTIDDSTDSLSLFPYANDATFKNLTIKGADGVSIKSSGNGTAAFVGIAGGSLTFENCTNKVEITSSGKNVGGILGQTAYDKDTTYKSDEISYTYTFIDCVNTAKLTNTVNNKKTGLGGIVGNALTSKGVDPSLDRDGNDTGTRIAEITLESCRNAGALNGTFNIGGIIGRNGGTATVTNCGNSGVITGTGTDDTNAGGIGGLVTYYADINVFASYNSGNINCSGNKAGGILAADCEYTDSESQTKIYYCYNTGNVTSEGCNIGGILGTMVYVDIQYCYNTGAITANGDSGWTGGSSYRVGGIVGFVDGNDQKQLKNIAYSYNIGLINNGKTATGASHIIGDSKTVYSGIKPLADLTTVSDTYSIDRCASKQNDDKRDGIVLKTEAAMTATMSGGVASMTTTDDNGKKFDIGQNITALDETDYKPLDNDETAFVTKVSDNKGIAGTSGGYIYVYGCLPQLAVFAVDTQNGLAMTSVAYGKDQYGDFSLQNAGSESNPFIIKDGIDLLGLQSLVEMGYAFDGKYIEFANKNNNLNATEVKEIVFNDSSNRYKTKNDSNYNENGKSYHLFEKASTIDMSSSNMLTIGNSYTFQGNISGIQYKDTTNDEGKVISTETITTKLVGGVASTGLFANVLNADISYIELENATISGGANTGGIVGTAYGRTTIDHCKISGTSSITSTTGNYVGGIVGYADTANGYNSDKSKINQYAQGVTLTISNCEIAGSADNSITIQGANSYIGGILGGIALGEGGKNNIVVISGGTVGGASISASSDGTKIGGILGYGSSNIIAGIRACTVGGSTTTDAGSSSDAMVAGGDDETGNASTINAVTISGKQNVGGIAGAMSNVQGGYIQDCTVNGNATISATANCSDIGGLVGSNDEGSGATLTFSGKIVFGGTIDLTYEKIEKTETKTVNSVANQIGGIIGTMNNGASFASGSTVTVGGSITGAGAGSTNIGGVAGYTVNVAFNGTFKVSPTMSTDNAENVGGFIGKNTGETHILADKTLVMINGTISGTNEVGGFIGVNDSGAQLVIGAYTYNGKSYDGDVNIYIGAELNDNDEYVSDGKSSISGDSNVGGIVGKNDKNVSEDKKTTLNIVRGTIVNYATISGTTECVGGIVGLNDGELTTESPNITNEGNVRGNDYVGGVFGRLNAGTITGTFTNNGSVSGASYVGGSIGYVDSAVTLTNVTMTNSGTVTGTGDYVGGSIGALYGTITNGTLENIFNTNENNYVSGANNVGGSIGALYGSLSGKLSNKGNVTASGNFVGGSIGYAGNTISGTLSNEGNVTATGNHVGGSIGYVGNTISGSLSNSGSVSGVSYVGGAIGSFNNGSYDKASIENRGTVTGTTSYVGGAIGYVASGVTISNATITNTRNVLGQTTTTTNGETKVNNTANYVGGSIGALYGSLSGMLSNEGNVSGANYVGGSIGYVAKDVKITNPTSGSTSFTNIGSVTASGNFVGGSIGILYGSIEGSNDNRIVFTVGEETSDTVSNVNVSGIGYVGGSIGVIAGKVNFAQFANYASLEVASGQTAIGGSVGMVGVPSDADLYNDVKNNKITISIEVSNSQFDALGSLTVTGGNSDGGVGVGGAIGIIGGSDEYFSSENWSNNTYYAQSNVIANGINNVGGVFGLIKADNFSISNMLAYRITVRGADSVGGIVGGVEGSNVTISSAFALEGNISGTGNVGGIVGKANDTTDASQAYWMLGIANSMIAGEKEGIKGLAKKLGFKTVKTVNGKQYQVTEYGTDGTAYSTGDKEHGWFFIYANDTSTNSDLGNVSAMHNTKTEGKNTVDDSLDYWKFIAQAYSADETHYTEYNGSNLTGGDGSINVGTIYATATASGTADSGTGFYMYTATYYSEEETALNPNINYASDTFYIDIDTTTKVGNFAVYYRQIAAGDDLTYNGYERIGVVGMEGVEMYTGTDITDDEFEEDERDKYYFTTSTKNTDENGNVLSTTITPINVGTYSSEINVYYVDKGGNVHYVGANDNMTWNIVARKYDVVLNGNDGSAANGYYGQHKYTGLTLSDGTAINPYDMKFVISNIAPGQYTKEVLTITVKKGKTENAQKVAEFTVNISESLSIGEIEKQNGISLQAFVSESAPVTADENTTADNEKNKEEHTDYKPKTLTCYLAFTYAADYDVTLTLSTSGTSAKNYSIKDEEDKDKTYSFSLNTRALTVVADEWTNGVTSSDKSGSPYTYNTKFQGLTKVKFAKDGKEGTGLLDGDEVSLAVTVTLTTVNNETCSATGTTSSFGKDASGDITAIINKLDKVGFAGTYTVSYEVAEDGAGRYSIPKDKDGISESTHTWEIYKYEVKFGGFSNETTSKTYDATPLIPVLNLETGRGISYESDGTYKYGDDTLSFTYEAGSDNVQKLVNAGTYEIEVKDGNGCTLNAKRNNLVTSDNYSFDNSTATGTFTITARSVKLNWESSQSFVYQNTAKGLKVTDATDDGVFTYALNSNGLSSAILEVKSGSETVDKITVNYYGSQKDVCNNKKMKYSDHSVDTSYSHSGVETKADNYTITNTTSPTFSIEKSIIKISSINVNNISKVYDGNEWLYRNNKYEAGVTGKITISKVESINGGAGGSTSYFTLSSAKFIGTNATDVVTAKKQIEATFTFSTSNTITKNYTCDSDSLTQKPTGGTITPAMITVTLNLKNGTATKTYDGKEYFGGANGATGNNQSQVYITGNGFEVSGVLGSDNVTIKAEFKEAGDGRSDFDSYVNGVYWDSTTKMYLQDASKYFKCLVFTMSSTDTVANNYSFNVYDKNDNAYSSTSGAGKDSTVTVYDSSDTASNHKNNNNSSAINIEITARQLTIDYTNTYQSYIASNGTYNDKWTRVAGTAKEDKNLKIVVTNGWMFSSGKDTFVEDDKGDKVYKNYTLIKGVAGSEILSAKVTPENGKEYNYTLKNQPTLTIAYVVPDKSDSGKMNVFEIDSMADLILASFYYSASQDASNSLFTQITQSSYKWVNLVSNDNYLTATFNKDSLPQGSPITESNATTWDEYLFAELRDAGYYVFLNVEATDNMAANTWGCFVAQNAESKSAIPTSFKLTKDLNGVFTAADIDILNNFFKITTDDNTETKTWGGASADYLKNVLTTKEGSVVTLLGSLFVTNKGTGFGLEFDGNGYVIEYLNIMGYGYGNVGFFDKIASSGIVKNVHLRNVSINANNSNTNNDSSNYVSVGGIAGFVDAGTTTDTKSIVNVSFHGSINVSGVGRMYVGGLFGQSTRAIEQAIVLGTINSSNSSAYVGGVLGGTSSSIIEVVSMMQINANGTTGVFVGSGIDSSKISKSYYMQNAVYNGTAFVNDLSYAKSYSDLMGGSNSAYSTGDKKTYDVLIDVDDKTTTANARQSLRLVDIVKVYLLMYSLNATTDTDGKITGYTIGDSWLVGNKLGTNATDDAIVIANKQNVSLLRELRFATFELKANVDVTISSTFSGTFYGTVNVVGNSKITCNKDMFGVYLNNKATWLQVSANS